MSEQLELGDLLAPDIPDRTLVGEELPYYARPKGDEKYYTIDGKPYVRMTHILDQVGGDHLRPWYAKQGCLSSAACLYRAGIQIPEEITQDEKGYEKLLDFCKAALAAHGPLTKEEAILEIYRWQVRMREAERYRDHRARVGSVTHHWAYRFATGDPMTRLRKEWPEYLRAITIDLRYGLWHKPRQPDFEPTEEEVNEVARLAETHVLSRYEWCEKALPDWESIGLEAVVVHEELELAGSLDEIYKLRKSNYEKHWPWPFKELEYPRIVGDIKCTNSMPEKVQEQVEGYAHCDYILLIQTGAKYALGHFDAVACCHVGPHPSLAQTQDEYGALETKAKQLGAKLYTWDRSEPAWESVKGLVARWRYINNKPKAHQQRQRTEPTPKSNKRLEAQPAQF